MIKIDVGYQNTKQYTENQKVQFFNSFGLLLMKIKVSLNQLQKYFEDIY